MKPEEAKNKGNNRPTGQWQRPAPVRPSTPDRPADMPLDTLRQNWQRERQGLPPLDVSSPHRATIRTAIVVPLDEDEDTYEQDMAAYVGGGYLPPDAQPIPPGRANYRGQRTRLNPLIIGGLAGLLILATVIVLALLAINSSNSSQSAQATAAATVTSDANIVEATRNAQARLDETNKNTQTQEQAYFDQGKTAFDSGKWNDAMTAWEKLDPNRDSFMKVRPMLVQAYFNQANILIGQTDKPEALDEALTLYYRAQQIDPNTPGLSNLIEKAQLYKEGTTKQGDNGDWNTALNDLQRLYQLDPHYRDVAQVYYDTLVRYGDEMTRLKRPTEATRAYNTALTVNGPDKKTATQHLADLKAQALPPEPSPTAVPVPTALPTPTPTPTPLPPTATPGANYAGSGGGGGYAAPPPAYYQPPAPTVAPTTAPPQPTAPGPCTRGGTGRNFYAFRVGQPPVPNTPDQGKSVLRGLVVDANHQPVKDVEIRITSGSFDLKAKTDGNGQYYLGGLGRAQWSLSVKSAPGLTLCYTPAQTVSLSGQAGFEVYVDFTESVP